MIKSYSKLKRLNKEKFKVPKSTQDIIPIDTIYKDGKDITTYKSFLTALYSHKAGDKVKVDVNRSGNEKTITVTLQEK